MIATRFRSVYWVGGVAVAALGCYLVSQRVASERIALARTEQAVVTAKRDIRALQTEIGTRAGMNQLEKWNADVLALSAPRASQFVTSEVQLAALVRPVRPAMDAPAVIQVAATVVAPPAAPQVTRVSYPTAPEPRRAALKLAAAEPRRPAAKLVLTALDDEDDTPRVRQAVYVKPGRDHENVALLDDRLLGDLDRIAFSERADGKRKR